MRVRVELYGRLRDAGLGPQAELDVPSGATARQVLAALARALGERAAWLDGAVLADETAVLGGEAPLPEGRRLAALPPVCGG